MEKKAWLDKLFYQVGKQGYDLELTYMRKENDNVKCSKWRKYSEIVFQIDFDGKSDNRKIEQLFNNVNNRTILPNEIVLDLEDKYEYGNIKTALDLLGFKYYLYKSGSRGYHFSLFFNEELTKEEKLILIRHFACDEQKAIDRCTIALEFAPHWKTGVPKRLIIPKRIPDTIELNKKEKLYELQEQDKKLQEEQEPNQDY